MSLPHFPHSLNATTYLAGTRSSANAASPSNTLLPQTATPLANTNLGRNSSCRAHCDENLLLHINQCRKLWTVGYAARLSRWCFTILSILRGSFPEGFGSEEQSLRHAFRNLRNTEATVQDRSAAIQEVKDFFAGPATRVDVGAENSHDIPELEIFSNFLTVNELNFEYKEWDGLVVAHTGRNILEIAGHIRARRFHYNFQ